MNSFWIWWQHIPANLDPVIFQIGSLRVQYYGLMYILAFLTTYFLARHRTRTEPRFPFSDEFHKDIMTAAFIGVLAGGRLGYVLFYNFSFYLQNPLKIILPFELDTCKFTGISGMSYHGGLIGVMTACAIFISRYNKNRMEKVSYWKLADLYGPIIPLGYTFGRIGNFINGELYGRITDSPIGMFFPDAPTRALRHPSQLYEALFEGVFAFLLMWLLRKKTMPEGTMASLYLISYGFVRFFIEYFRQPDTHLGFIILRFSMGQILCSAMILAGAFLYIFLLTREKRLQGATLKK